MANERKFWALNLRVLIWVAAVLRVLFGDLRMNTPPKFNSSPPENDLPKKESTLERPSFFRGYVS